MELKEIFQLVEKERTRQIEMWGADRCLDPETYLRIMVEEMGEIARAIQEEDWENLQTEIIQVMAVGACWLQKG